MSEQYSHDVFISFSFKDQAIVDRIVNQLTNKYRIPCWICTKKIRAGSYYYDEIENAISSSKVFLFVQTKNSVESKEIPDEVLTAIDEGKTIISFIVEESDLHGQMKLKLKHRQHIDATIPEFDDRIRDLATELYALLGRTLDDEHCPVANEPEKEKLVSTPSVIPKSVFCGREDVIKDIAQKFDDGERVVFVQGIGGIGKTEIVKQYAKRYKNNYDTIIFATYADSLLSLINSETPFEIEPEFSRLVQTDGVQEDEHSFFERKLKKIQKLSNERTLIIIDNFDVEHDDALPELMKGKYRLLITTRCDYSRVYPCVKVGPIESIESLVRVFMENYQGFDVDENDPDLVELIELVNRHTYTIELLAQHMENSGQTAREMIEALQSEGILSLNEEVQHAGNKTQVAYKNLLKMFKVFDLSDTEKAVLRYLSLMPLSGVSVRDFKGWANLNSPKILRDLEGRSWITRNVDGIALHPIIRDVIKHELPVNDINCRDFVVRFIETIEENKAWHFTMSDKEKYANIATGIIAAFPEINENTIALYKAVEVLYSFSVRPQIAAELAERIFVFYESTSGRYSFDSARAAFKAGWVFAFNLWLDDALVNAEIWLEIAIEILEKIELISVREHATYGHTLVNLSKISLLLNDAKGDASYLKNAKEYAEAAIKINERWIPEGDPQYPKVAGGYMQLADVCIALGDYELAMRLNDDAYNILYPLFGEDDSDTLHAMSRKVKILYGMKRFEEALTLSEITVEKYDRFYSEIHFARYDQLVIKLKCLIATERVDEAKELLEYILNLANRIFAPNAKQLYDILAIASEL